MLWAPKTFAKKYGWENFYNLAEKIVYQQPSFYAHSQLMKEAL